MADEMSTPATHPEDWREHDELQNLYFALMDLAWRMKGWGPLAPGEEVADERMAEVRPLVQEVMAMWGLSREERVLADNQDAAENAIEVESGYGALSHRPFVTVRIVGQLRPESARLAALWLMDAAATAEQDAITVDWAEKTLDISGGAASRASAHMMRELRRFREASRAKDGEEEESAPVSELQRAAPRLIGARLKRG